MKTTEYESHKTLFEKVANSINWKLPITPFNTKSYIEAVAVQQAVTFFVGGAELHKHPQGDFTVKSEGYYHYIGA